MSELDEIKKRLGAIEKVLSEALKPMLTLKEASAYTGISYRQLDELCRRREIPFSQPGRYRFVLRADLLEYMSRNKIQSKTAIEDKANSYILNH